MTQAEHEVINVQLARIETKVDIVLDEHEKRIDKLEKNFVSVVIGTVVMGIGLYIKGLFTGGKA